MGYVRLRINNIVSIISSDSFTSFLQFVLHIGKVVRRLNWHRDNLYYHIATMEGIKETFAQCKKENRVSPTAVNGREHDSALN